MSENRVLKTFKKSNSNKKTVCPKDEAGESLDFYCETSTFKLHSFTNFIQKRIRRKLQRIQFVLVVANFPVLPSPNILHESLVANC